MMVRLKRNCVTFTNEVITWFCPYGVSITYKYSMRSEYKPIIAIIELESISNRSVPYDTGYEV